MLYDAICVRCGAELEYPDVTLPSEAELWRERTAH
jgi:hypothetical protein